MKTALIVTREGLQEADLLFTRGEWAVTRERVWDACYNVTHLPTGFRVPVIEELPTALALAKALGSGAPPCDLRTLPEVKPLLSDITNAVLRFRRHG